MDYTCTRSKRDGWKCETVIPLGTINGANRELQVSTWKGQRGIICTAQVVKREDGMISFVFGMGPGGDYHKTLADDRGGKGTEANLRRTHERCLAGIEGVKEAALAYYRASAIAKEQEATA
jgi:hypothetical protein